jgi:acyl-CoA synthetase (AMP-forming)/AMP-acid ligase II
MATAAPPRGANPFDDSGVRADTGGVRHYPGLHASLLEMLRDSVRAAPGAEALAEVGGRRISYAQLWDGAARVAGGLREAGIRPGDRVAVQIGERFAAARLANGFGLTESTSIATVLPHEWAAGHADSVGFAAPHTEVAIDTGAGPGEILIRGQSVCDGYWHNPEATVYCVEVENALIGAPGVGEVAVVGVPDDMMGEKVGVVIVPLPGASVDPKVVVDYAREHLADFKVPQFIAVSTTPLFG